jgi:preprotein translocase subunit Sec63
VYHDGVQRNECFRVLELKADATPDEIRRAQRELTKVWHPDRFGNDPELRRRAEEKLKEINEAAETLLGERTDRARPSAPDPQAARRQQRMVSALWAVSSAMLAIMLLLRRPSIGTLVVAVLLFIISWRFLQRMRD